MQAHGEDSLVDAPICVIGLGNLLQRDDGFGPRALEWIERHCDCPEGVEFVDVGTAGLHLIRWIVGRRAVLILDACTAGTAPGTVSVFHRERVLEGECTGVRISPHQPDIREILRMAEVVDRMPDEVVLIGAEPRTMEQGLELSPEVEAAIPAAARELARELRRLGVALELRETEACNS